MTKDTYLTPLTLGVEGGSKDPQVASAREEMLDFPVFVPWIARYSSLLFSDL